MLLPFLVVLALTGVAVLIVAKAGHVAMRRLGLDLYDVLLWLGLAEAPVDELSARRMSSPSARDRRLASRSASRQSLAG